MFSIDISGEIPEEVLIAFVIKGLPKKMADTIKLNTKDKLSWDNLYGICERLQVTRKTHGYREQ
jgi:hypothetical protein